MSCEAANETVMANRSDWRLLKPASTPGPFGAVSLMRRRRADSIGALGGTSRPIRGRMYGSNRIHSLRQQPGARKRSM